MTSQSLALDLRHLTGGRDFVVRLGQTAAASKFLGKIEQFPEEYLVAEEGPDTIPFGGRDPEFRKLDHWLSEDTAPSRFVLVAPAGRGKSALLVHWLRQLQARHDAQFREVHGDLVEMARIAEIVRAIGRVVHIGVDTHRDIQLHAFRIQRIIAAVGIAESFRGCGSYNPTAAGL